MYQYQEDRLKKEWTYDELCEIYFQKSEAEQECLRE